MDVLPAQAGIQPLLRLFTILSILKAVKIDGFVKSLKTSFDVIPVKAGIQCFQIVLDACPHRHDGISHFLRVCQNSGL